MTQQHFLELIVNFIPEGIALSFMIMVLLKKSFTYKDILKIGCVSGVATYTFRLLPLSFGFHTVLTILTLTLLVTWYYKEGVVDIFIAVLKTFIIGSIMEIVCTFMLIQFISIKPEQIPNNFTIKTIVVLSYVSLMFITGKFILYLRNRNLHNHQNNGDPYEKMIKNLSGYLAQELNLSSGKKDRIRFGLELLFSTLLSLSFSIIIALIFGLVKPVIFILISGALLKVFAGGIHLETPWECAVATAISTNILGYLAYIYHEVLYNNWLIFIILSTCFIFISLFLWSPAEVPEKPIKEKKEKKLFKQLSIFTAGLMIIIISIIFILAKKKFSLIAVSLTLGLIFQAFTINPISYLLQNGYQRFRNFCAK